MITNNRVAFLKDNTDFPPLENSLKDGLLAAGGDLSDERLLKAYKSGIFPWYDEFSPILWYSPPRRCVMKPENFRLSKSLKRKLDTGLFTISIDENFPAVIAACANTKRKHETGTWILPEMIEAYTRLHNNGFAHSVEVWQNGILAGGLYGISLGKAFFGESMFHEVTDASKAALHYLCKWLAKNEFQFIDAQIETDHLLSLGAKTVSRNTYLTMLQEALKHPTIKGPWKRI